jgi:hypothetical protein
MSECVLWMLVMINMGPISFPWWVNRDTAPNAPRFVMVIPRQEFVCLPEGQNPNLIGAGKADKTSNDVKGSQNPSPEP